LHYLVKIKHYISYFYTALIERGVKHKVHQVQRKQIDNHKVCSKCRPLARSQTHKCVRH